MDRVREGDEQDGDSEAVSERANEALVEEEAHPYEVDEELWVVGAAPAGPLLEEEPPSRIGEKQDANQDCESACNL